ncbi:protein AbnA [Zychaea mexicana]|uniref:protein AbnA n=1 Tax=Zychaea mexicana TaxID=64656 RepID=UPI0022FDCEDF|nr:protein AbnA [Zychaea mexicana]KAI9488325.1 protein AbnA [Zychaea mexicana]
MLKNYSWKSLLFAITASSSMLLNKGLVSGAAWPLTGDVGCHDPTIIQEGSRWYTFCTGQGITVLTSEDGLAWSTVPQIFLNELPWWANYVPGHPELDVWAPDVSTFNGRTYLYYSISTFGSRTSVIGLASASSIDAGSWTDEGAVISTTQAGNDYNAIDPFFVVDQDGNPWLAFGSFGSGIKITAIDPSTMKPTGDIHSIAARSGGIEAPSIIYQGGYYHLIVSIDSCCQGTSSTYKIAYARSESILGPYLNEDGVDAMNGGVTVLDAGNDRWIGPGGQDVYESVIARHAYDAENNGAPILLISDLNWSNGWPTY